MHKSKVLQVDTVFFILPVLFYEDATIVFDENRGIRPTGPTKLCIG